MAEYERQFTQILAARNTTFSAQVVYFLPESRRESLNVELRKDKENESPDISRMIQKDAKDFTCAAYKGKKR